MGRYRPLYFLVETGFRPHLFYYQTSPSTFLGSPSSLPFSPELSLICLNSKLLGAYEVGKWVLDQATKLPKALTALTAPTLAACMAWFIFQDAWGLSSLSQRECVRSHGQQCHAGLTSESWSSWMGPRFCHLGFPLCLRPAGAKGPRGWTWSACGASVPHSGWLSYRESSWHFELLSLRYSVTL